MENHIAWNVTTETTHGLAARYLDKRNEGNPSRAWVGIAPGRAPVEKIVTYAAAGVDIREGEKLAMTSERKETGHEETIEAAG